MNEGQAVNLSVPANLELADEIGRRRKEHYEPLTPPRPRRSHWPSDLSTCARQMVYKRVAWDKLPPTTVELQERFEAGRAVEDRIKRELTNLGFELVASGLGMGRSSKMEQYGIYGKLDTVIKFNGKHVLIEIKSMHPAVWKRINTLEDMEKDFYMRKYLRQIQVYLLAFELELGLFIMDDCMNHWKAVPIYLDYDYAESILGNVEIANKHLPSWNGSEGTLPNRIEYGEECQKCPFAHICLPNVVNEGTAIVIDSKEMEEKLQRHEELKPLAKEYDEIHDEVSECFKGKPQSIVGQFFVTAKEYMRTKYDIPPEVKSQYASQEKSYRVSIQALKPGGSA